MVWSPSTLDGLDASTCHTLWHKETQAKDLRVVGNMIYTIFIDVPDGGLGGIVTGLRALHLQNGAQRWQVPSGNTFVSLVADGGILYLETQQGEVDARQVTDGKLLWHHLGSNRVLSLSMENHMLYLVGKDSGDVIALDPIMGTTRWHVALGNSLSGFTVA